MTLGDRKEWRRGWAYQVVRLHMKDAKGYGRKRHWADPLPKGVQRGYVKLWRRVDGQWMVVDRALTVAAAKRRARTVLKSEER